LLVPENPEPQVNLKDPVIAGVLAWLVPGLGHLYQGRYAKAALFGICILGTFFYGLYLGSSSQVGWGRVVYLSFRQNDFRPAYLCQVGVGLPALPALVQADRFRNGKTPLWHGFMAPPKLNADDPGKESLHVLYRQLPTYFEMGTVFTMIAGLLNILAIYDACCGPVFQETAKKKEDDEPKPAEGKAENHA
jgi:hypothetical protein